MPKFRLILGLLVAISLLTKIAMQAQFSSKNQQISIKLTSKEIEEFNFYHPQLIQHLKSMGDHYIDDEEAIVYADR